MAQSNGDSLFVALDAVFRKAGLHPGNDETDTQFFDEVYSVAKQDRKQHELEARIEELDKLYDEVEPPSDYDVCDVVHEHRIAERIAELKSQGETDGR